MVFPKLDEAFNGNNVRLLLTDSGLQEDFNLYNMTKKKTTPRNRIDSRGGAGDFYAAQLREITYETVVTEQMFLYLNTQSTLNARSVIPGTVCQVISDSVDGASDLTEDFTAEIIEMEDNSIDGSYYWVRVHMIIKPGSYTVT